MNLPLVIWLTLSATGFALLAVYQNMPGIETAQTIPIQRSNGLVVECYIHPECECSKSSLYDIQKILSEIDSDSPINLSIYVFSAAGIDSNSVHRRLHEDLNWSVQYDLEGAIAQKAGVTTSGHVSIAFDGEMIFSGGVTSSRGVSGSNPYSEQFKSVLNTPQKVQHLITTPVFGCSISP